MGLFEEYDAFSQQDLDLFSKNFAPNVPQGTSPQVDSVDGGTAPVKASSVRNSGESDIDLDLTYSLIYPQSVRIPHLNHSSLTFIRNLRLVKLLTAHLTTYR